MATQEEQEGFRRLHERIKHLHDKCQNYLNWKTKTEAILGIGESRPSTVYYKVEALKKERDEYKRKYEELVRLSLPPAWPLWPSWW